MSGIKTIGRVLLLSERKQTFAAVQEVRESQVEGLPQEQPGYGSSQNERVVLEQPGQEKRVHPSLEIDSKQQQTTTTAIDNICTDISRNDKICNDRTRNDKRQHTTATDSRNVTIRRTASSVRIREKLSNGQLLSVFFKRIRNKSNPGGGIHYIWSLAVHIGYSRKQANRWYHMPYTQRIKTIQQTGDCGLEGLRKALGYLMEHCESMGQYEELQIYCDDAKRYRTYRYLVKHYKGFTEHVASPGQMIIAYANPAFYGSEGQT